MVQSSEVQSSRLMTGLVTDVQGYAEHRPLFLGLLHDYNSWRLFRRKKTLNFEPGTRNCPSERLFGLGLALGTRTGDQLLNQDEAQENETNDHPE